MPTVEFERYERAKSQADRIELLERDVQGLRRGIAELRAIVEAFSENVLALPKRKRVAARRRAKSARCA